MEEGHGRYSCEGEQIFLISYYVDEIKTIYYWLRYFNDTDSTTHQWNTACTGTHWITTVSCSVDVSFVTQNGAMVLYFLLAKTPSSCTTLARLSSNAPTLINSLIVLLSMWVMCVIILNIDYEAKP